MGREGIRKTGRAPVCPAEGGRRRPGRAGCRCAPVGALGSPGCRSPSPRSGPAAPGARLRAPLLPPGVRIPLLLPGPAEALLTMSLCTNSTDLGSRAAFFLLMLGRNCSPGPRSCVRCAALQRGLRI